MKKLAILTAALVLANLCFGFGLMKKAVTIGASSASNNNPVRGPGAAILGFGGENIQDLGGNNILGIGPIQ